MLPAADRLQSFHIEFAAHAGRDISIAQHCHSITKSCYQTSTSLQCVQLAQHLLAEIQRLCRWSDCISGGSSPGSAPADHPLGRVAVALQSAACSVPVEAAAATAVRVAAAAAALLCLSGAPPAVPALLLLPHAQLLPADKAASHDKLMPAALYSVQVRHPLHCAAISMRPQAGTTNLHCGRAWGLLEAPLSVGDWPVCLAAKAVERSAHASVLNCQKRGSVRNVGVRSLL